MWEKCRKWMLHIIAKKKSRKQQKCIFKEINVLARSIVNSSFQKRDSNTQVSCYSLIHSTPPQVSQFPWTHIFIGVSDHDAANDLIWVWQYSSCRSRTLLSPWAMHTHPMLLLQSFIKWPWYHGNDDDDLPENFHGKKKCFHLAALPCLCYSSEEYG